MTDSGPLVSIVTATKQRAPLLEMTLRSVRAQTYGNIEHIVIDGASTDGTVELLRRFEGTYPLRWVSRPDAGMYPAINAGLQEGAGEILAYLNSDDLYFPWTIERVVRAFSENGKADFIFGDTLAIDDSTGESTIYWMPPFDLEYIRRSGFLAQPSVFWRKTAYDRLGPFDESLRFVADCDYWMRAGETSSFVKVNEFLAIERNHEATLRSAVDAPVWAELEQVRNRYVSTTGLSHERAVRRLRLRARLWSRLYATAFGVLACIPRPLRRGPWSELLISGHPQFGRLQFLLHALPFLGRLSFVRMRQGGTVLKPSRYWLEPRG
jgi:glycosyltransferase involved in cell wall biosynthesis